MSHFPEEPLQLSSSDGFGYSPAYPGLVLNDQYTVTRKLGYGPRSSVWMVVSSQNYGYFAVKILTAQYTNLAPSQEISALKVARQNEYINFYGSFTATSPHGLHLCLVLDVAGPSLEYLRNTSPTASLSTPVVQRAVACIVENLKKLHKCGIIHGAITTGNIATEVDTSRESLDEDLSELPPCTIEQTVVLNGLQYPVVRSCPIPNWIRWNDTQADVNRNCVNLINLGHAQKMKDDPTWEKLRVDKSLRPPEIILGLPYSSKVDTWMLGCATYHMLTGRTLVPEARVANDGAMLAWLTAMSGQQVPPEMALQSKLKYQYLDENGTLKIEIGEERLEEVISSGNVVPSSDIPGIVKFVQRCLTLDPARRPTPDDLFMDEWVEPGYEG